jgi:hypothetical protein
MANGWNSDGTPKNGIEARTVFLNNNDLGYVRDMHCISKRIDPALDLRPEPDSDTRVACWVANYSTPANQEVREKGGSPSPSFFFPPEPDVGQLESDFENAANTPPDGNTALAPVTMEYRKIPGVNGGNPVVTFIAYGNPPNGKLEDALVAEGSDQDGFGKKPVPGMCNTCHGGSDFTASNPPTPDDANVKGSFIVFDLSTFIFSNVPGRKRADLEPAFKKQNTAVLETAPPAAIRQLIEGWYGAGLSRRSANDEFVPDRWKGQAVGDGSTGLTSEKLYLNVVRTCRTCHTALAQPTNNSWSTYSGFERLLTRSARVCSKLYGDNQRDMPHTAISYLNFWRFKPPDLPPDYQMGGPDATDAIKMRQPFLDMGAFLVANGRDPGACVNSKGLAP